MSERVRIEHYEADSVRRIVAAYRRDRQNDRTRGDVLAEDLVNAIGEVYERALARGHAKVKRAARGDRGGRSVRQAGNTIILLLLLLLSADWYLRRLRDRLCLSDRFKPQQCALLVSEHNEWFYGYRMDEKREFIAFRYWDGGR